MSFIKLPCHIPCGSPICLVFIPEIATSFGYSVYRRHDESALPKYLLPGTFLFLCQRKEFLKRVWPNGFSLNAKFALLFSISSNSHQSADKFESLQLRSRLESFQLVSNPKLPTFNDGSNFSFLVSRHWLNRLTPSSITGLVSYRKSIFF